MVNDVRRKMHVTEAVVSEATLQWLETVLHGGVLMTIAVAARLLLRRFPQISSGCVRAKLVVVADACAGEHTS